MSCNLKKKIIVATGEEAVQIEGAGERKKATPRKRAAPGGNADGRSPSIHGYGFLLTFGTGTPKKRGRKTKAEILAAEKDDEESKVKTETKAEDDDEDEGVAKLLAGAREYAEAKESTEKKDGLVGAESDDEV